MGPTFSPYLLHIVWNLCPEAKGSPPTHTMSLSSSYSMARHPLIRWPVVPTIIFFLKLNFSCRVGILGNLAEGIHRSVLDLHVVAANKRQRTLIDIAVFFIALKLILLTHFFIRMALSNSGWFLKALMLYMTTGRFALVIRGRRTNSVLSWGRLRYNGMRANFLVLSITYNWGDEDDPRLYGLRLLFKGCLRPVGETPTKGRRKL